MTTFHDALSGEKRQFNFKTKATPAPYVKVPWCADSKYFFDHDFTNKQDDHSPCIRCGVTLVRARVLQNMRTKK